MSKLVFDDIKKLAYNGGLAIIFAGIGYLFLFVFKLLIARQFGPEDLGYYDLTIIIFNLLLVISSFGIPKSVLKFIPLYIEKNKLSLLKGYVRFTIFIPLAISLFISVVVFFGASFLVSLFSWPESIEQSLKLLIFFLPFKVTISTLRYVLVSKNKIAYSTFSYNVLERLLLLLGLLVVVFSHLPIIYLILTYGCATVINFLFDLYQSRNIFAITTVKKPAYDTKRWLSFSLPLLFTGFFGFLVGWTDTLVLGSFLDLTSLGLYSAAYSLASSLLFFKEIFAPIFTLIVSQKFAKKEKNKIPLIFSKLQSWSFGFGSSLGFLMLFFSGLLLSLVFGDPFKAASMPFVILTTGFLITLFLGPSKSILLVHEKSNFLFKVTVVTAILNVVGNLVLVTKYGFIGVAISSAVTIVIHNIILYVKVKSLEKISISLSSNMKFILASAITVVTTYVLYVLFPKEWIFLIILLAIFGLLLIGLYFLFKVFDETDKLLFLELKKKIMKK